MSPPPRPLDFATLTIVEETPPSEHTTHSAACHCGTIVYTVKLKWPFPKYPVNKCTCSICSSQGSLYVYPARRDVIFEKGYDNLQSYQFHKKNVAHKFCKTCGSNVLVDFLRKEQGETDPAKDILGTNVRMFKNIDLDALEYTFFDGKTLL